MVRLVISSAIALTLVSPGFAVVRRAKAGHSHGESENQGAQTAVHCVVWGDGHFEGSRVHTREEADLLFDKLKRSELAAVQYDNLHEVRRFKSRRLKAVDWTKTKDFCNQDGHSSSAGLESSLFQAATSDVPAHSHMVFEPSDSTIAEPVEPVVRSLDSKASTLTSKLELVEKELSVLGSKASTLLKNIGVADKSSSPAMLFEVDAASGANLNRKGHGKLKTRLAALEEYALSVQEKANVLETEFFGSTTADKIFAKSEGLHSFKNKIETLAAQADELRGRMARLMSSGLLKDVSKLDEKLAALSSKAADVFKSVGVDGADVAEKAASSAKQQTGNLRERLGTMESYTEELQRGAASLEFELLENSWNAPTTGSQKALCIKDHAESLGSKLEDLHRRLAALEAAPAVRDVDKLEGAITALFSRAATLSKNVGVPAKLPDDASAALSPKGSALKPRIAALDVYVSKMQDTMAALEDQLAGSVGSMPAQSRKDSLKGKIRFLELQTENINARMSALEQQV